MSRRGELLSGLLDGIVAWTVRWSTAFPDPAWDELRAGLAKMSTSKAKADAYPRAIGRWLRKHPELSAQIDAAVDADRLSRRAFDLERRNRLQAPAGRFSRKAMREGRAD